MNEQQVLAEPFNAEIHKKTFINYLEVIILESGEIIYAVPSHQEKMIALACQKLNMTRDELNDHCPIEYYADFMTWLIQLTGAVSVWNDMKMGTPNEQQLQSLIHLKNEGLYRGSL